MPRPASTTTTTANTAFCWPGDSSIGPGYFLRRAGRSQNGFDPSDSGPLAPLPSRWPSGGAEPDEPPPSPDPPPIQPSELRIGPGSQRGRPDGPAQGPLPDWPGGRAQGPRPPLARGRERTPEPPGPPEPA